MTELTDIEKRLIDRIDRFESKMDITCNTISKIDKELALIKQSLNNHLTTTEKNVKARFNKVTIILGIVVGITGVVAVFK